MSLFDAYGYQGKRVLVVGGATGMGNAVAQVVRDAGAEVIVYDRAEVTLDGVKSGRVDMSDEASITACVEEVGGTIDALFSCAGVADGTPGIEKINFLGHRLMINLMRERGMLQRGSAIGFISSAAGLGWENSLELITPYLDIEDFDEASKWAHDNAKADYMWSKRAINAYVAREAFNFLKDGIRINAILPGPTDTPLAQANADLWLTFGSDYRGEIGIEASTPLQQAYPLVFLCSDSASVITGITLVTDAGYVASAVTGSFPAGTPVIEFLTTYTG